MLWKAAAHPRFAPNKPGSSVSLMGVKGNWTEAILQSVAEGEIKHFVPTTTANAA